MLAGLASPEPKEGLTDPDDVPEPPDEPITKPGDLWLLGEHRLLCGDAGSEADLDRLLDGVTVDLLLTDPPYNVKVEPRSNNAIAAGMAASHDESYQAALASASRRRGTKALDAQGLHHSGFDVARGKSGIRHHQKLDLERHPEKAQATHRKLRAKDRPLVNDFISDEAFEALLLAWFSNASRVLRPGGSFYIWGGYANLGNYPPALKAAGLYFSQAIIWDKEHPVLTRKDLMGAHETGFYGWKEGAAHRYFGPPNATDLWHVKKVSPNAMVHLTEKCE
jgi:DNA modification methylase